MSRRQYMVDLRAQIVDVTRGVASLTLDDVEQLLAPGRAGIEPPGRVTLAKAVTGLGWTKHHRPGAPSLYKAPGQ
ncbi:MAG: hypothetical protein V4475_01770 [Pseudomonadota bacterium]